MIRISKSDHHKLLALRPVCRSAWSAKQPTKNITNHMFPRAEHNLENVAQTHVISYCFPLAPKGLGLRPFQKIVTGDIWRIMEIELES